MVFLIMKYIYNKKRGGILFRSSDLHNSVFKSIPIESIINVNTSLTKMFQVKHIEYQKGAAPD